MKPLLAPSGSVDPASVKFPVYVSPKLDGIRCLIEKGKAVTRTFKAIPNDHIRNLLSDKDLTGLDGEIIAGKTFQETTGNVMRQSGEPNFTFWVFDDFTQPTDPFVWRNGKVEVRQGLGFPSYVGVVPQVIANDLETLMIYHKGNIKAGFEGSMLRSPTGIYKFGRSTENEGILLKLKPFKRIEVRIVGFEELTTNENEAKKDAFGRTKRGASKANLVPAGTLGAFICTHPDFEGTFKVGTGIGMTKTFRQYVWDHQAEFLHALAAVDFQEEGTVDKPRIPSFQGIRDPIDV